MLRVKNPFFTPRKNVCFQRTCFLLAISITRPVLRPPLNKASLDALDELRNFHKIESSRAKMNESKKKKRCAK